MKLFFHVRSQPVDGWRSSDEFIILLVYCRNVGLVAACQLMEKIKIRNQAKTLKNISYLRFCVLDYINCPENGSNLHCLTKNAVVLLEVLDLNLSCDMNSVI